MNLGKTSEKNTTTSPMSFEKLTVHKEQAVLFADIAAAGQIVVKGASQCDCSSVD